MQYQQFSKHLTIALSKKSYATVKSISEYDRISMAEIIRGFIDNALESIDNDPTPDIDSDTSYQPAA